MSRPIGVVCECASLSCDCLKKAQSEWDKKYWLARRKEHEAKLIQLALFTKKKTKRFIQELDKISAILEECTKELEKLKTER